MGILTELLLSQQSAISTNFILLFYSAIAEVSAGVSIDITCL
jgi:hypothetical protein